MHRITDRVWVETGYEGANVGCILTSKGVVCVESPMSPPDAKEWASRVREISGLPVIYLINTDHHFDHSIGNCFLGGRVIMHEACLEGLREVREGFEEMFKRFFQRRYEEVKGELGEVKVLDPEITFSERLTLRLGEVTVEVVHVGGHCPATCYVYVPEEKVLFTGDLVTEGQHPYMGEANFGEWMRGLEEMMGLEVEHLVPGHGEVTDKSALEKLIDFFLLMERKAGEGDEDIEELYGFYLVEPGREEMVREWIRDGLRRMRGETSRG